jgi:hypothetical protein
MKDADKNAQRSYFTTEQCASGTAAMSRNRNANKTKQVYKRMEDLTRQLLLAQHIPGCECTPMCKTVQDLPTRSQKLASSSLESSWTWTWIWTTHWIPAWLQHLSRCAHAT